MHRNSLRTRLIAAAAAWAVVGLIAAGLVLRLAFEDSVQRSFQLRLMATLRSLVAAVEADADGGLRLLRPVGDPRFEQAYTGWYWQISGPGIMLRSRSLWDFELPSAPPGEPGTVVFGKGTGPRDAGLLTAERDLNFPPSTETVHVVVAADRHDVDREIARFDTVLLLSFACLGAGLVAAIWFQAGFGLRPLGRIAQDLSQLRSTPGARLDGNYPPEIAPLVEALNTVLDHDAAVVARARTHVGNLAHGLKTPLAVMLAELESGHPDMPALRLQVDRISRLIEHQLTRARSEATLARAIGAKTMIRPVAEDIAQTLGKVYGRRGITLTVDVPSALTFPGDAEDLAEMLGNLAENACKWASSRVRISGGDNGLTVEDDGPGLSEAQCTAVTRRGARLDENAPGHGLGLSIVSDLAHLYGGRLELWRSNGGGLAAGLLIPLSGSDRRN
jgi:signal transduction histidine kinase